MKKIFSVQFKWHPLLWGAGVGSSVPRVIKCLLSTTSIDPAFPLNKRNWNRKFSLGHVSAKSSNDDESLDSDVKKHTTSSSTDKYKIVDQKCYDGRLNQYDYQHKRHIDILDSSKEAATYAVNTSHTDEGCGIGDRFTKSSRNCNRENLDDCISSDEKNIESKTLSGERFIWNPLRRSTKRRKVSDEINIPKPQSPQPAKEKMKILWTSLK